MDRKIIIALIIIVLIALVGLVSFSTGIKSDTQINFLTGSNLKNGDQIQFELVDARGNALSNQNIDITFNGSDEKQNFTITTDEQGRGALVLKDENSGNYTVSVSYGGDDKHNGCTNKQLIIIGENNTSKSSEDYAYESNQQTSTDTSHSSTYASSANSNDNGQSNEHVDSDGKIQGGQNDGVDADYLKTHEQKVVDGSLE